MQFWELCSLELSTSKFMKEVVFRGNTYQKSNYIVLEKQDNDLVTGKVITMLLSNSKLFLCVEVFLATHLYDYDCYCIDNTSVEKNMRCVT